MIQSPDISLVLILLLFGIAYWILGRFLLRPVSAILECREEEEESAAKVYADTRHEFEAALRRIEESLSVARQQALKTREGLRAEGRTVFEEKLAAARVASGQRIEEAAVTIEREATLAQTELPGKVASVARELAAKVLGRPVAA